MVTPLHADLTAPTGRGTAAAAAAAVAAAVPAWGAADVQAALQGIDELQTGVADPYHSTSTARRTAGTPTAASVHHAYLGMQQRSHLITKQA
jgi:hypothetical protein